MAPPPAPTNPSAGAEPEEDDYMNMTFSEPTTTKTETSIQRRVRKQREAEMKSRAKTRAEIEAEESAVREAALATSIDSSNKGFRMMQKLGFKGGALGKEGAEARTEPIRVVMKEDRGGVGMEAEKKRKFREEVEGEVKRVKEDEGEYRERVRREREEKRVEGQVVSAMGVAERLDEKTEAERIEREGVSEVAEPQQDVEAPASKEPHRQTSKPLHRINVLWRGLVRHRIEKERNRRARYDLHQSLSRLPTYEDPDEDADFKHAMGTEEEVLEEEDPELDAFLALEPREKLEKLVAYLRERFRYCFWCKYEYPDEGMEGCPGVTEEDHD